MNKVLFGAFIVVVLSAQAAHGQALQITTASLPAGTVGTAYSQTLNATGGNPPYTWSIASGSLPAGLMLSSAGAITGTPTTAGTSNFTVRAAGGGNDTRALSIVVNPAPTPLSITTTTLPAGTMGTAYSQNLAATGGTTPYTWTIASGSLPAGVTLSTSGGISGTPTTAGTSNFTVRVTDNVSQMVTRALSITINAALSITTASPLPSGSVGTSYSQTFAAAGGASPYTWTLLSGSLPAGLTLSAAGVLSGSPTTAATSNFTIRVTDTNSQTTSKAFALTVNAATPPPVSVTTASLPGGTIGSAYSQTLAATGGTPPYTWAVTAGSLPAGLILSTAGAITGTPTTAGTSNFTVRATDSGSQTAFKDLSITVAAGLSITTASPLPNGTVSVSYSQTFAVSGGTGPYTWSVLSGSLPSGLTLSAAGVLSGTPTAAATSNFTIQVTASGSLVTSKAFALTVNAATPPPVSVTTASLPGGTMGSVYSQTLAATGGTPPYTWAVTAGSLPAGLILSTAGAITGTPTTAGTSNFTVRATDSGSQTAFKDLSITVAAGLSITTASPLPNGTVSVSYSQTFAVSGGTGPYTWSVLSGSPPSGLTLSAAGVLSGTPTAAATSNFTIQVTASGSLVTSKAFALTVNPPAPVVQTASLPAGVTGTAYSQNLAASGGTAPYTWSITAGSLPAGLNLAAGGMISGTPTTAGASNFTVRATDSASQTGSRDLSITITGALSITTSSLPDGRVGFAYSQPLAAAGGTPPYAWALAPGSLPLPAGLTLSAQGLISGSPTTTGTSTFSVRVADNATQSATRSLSITIDPPAVSITTSSLPPGTAGSAYSQTLVATGGSPPYTWSVTAGSLPAGLTLSNAGVLSGTPPTQGTSNFTVQVRDSANQTASRALSITVAGPGLAIATNSPLPSGVVNRPYSQSLNATGGTPPYTWSLAGGTLPAGLTLSPSGSISGTATAPGTFNFTVRVTDDSATPLTKALTIRIDLPITIVTSSSLPQGFVRTAYSQSLVASGGVEPYSWALAGGVLPIGLTLNLSGVISGTPMAPGPFNFSARVTDGAGQTVVRDFTLIIALPLSISTPTPLGNGSVGIPYSATLIATGGTAPYTWTTSGGQLPTGLVLSSNGVLSGTPSTEGTYNFSARVSDNGTQIVTASLAITIQTGLTITTASPLPSAVTDVPYSHQLRASLPDPLNWSLVSGQLPSGIDLSPSGLLSGTPSSPGIFDFTVRVVGGSPEQTVSQPLRLEVVPALLITTAGLPAGTVSVGYAAVLSASGGIGEYSWTLNTGALPDGMTLATSGLITGLPARAGQFPFTVQVADTTGLRAIKAFAISIVISPVGPIFLTGVPATLSPTQQVPIALALSTPAPTALAGTLTMSFNSNSVVSGDDPALRFSTGARSVPFTISAGNTIADFPAQLSLLSGTVAGTVVLTATVDQAPGEGIPVGSMLIRPMTPQLTNISATRTAGGIRVQVTGFSPERRVTNAEFGFDVRTAAGIQRIDLTRNVEADFDGWYRSPASASFGSTFLFEQLFTVAGDPTMIQSVVIRLSNGQGAGTLVLTAVGSN